MKLIGSLNFEELVSVYRMLPLNFEEYFNIFESDLLVIAHPVSSIMLILLTGWHADSDAEPEHH